MGEGIGIRGGVGGGERGGGGEGGGGGEAGMVVGRSIEDQRMDKEKLGDGSGEEGSRKMEGVDDDESREKKNG